MKTQEVKLTFPADSSVGTLLHRIPWRRLQGVITERLNQYGYDVTIVDLPRDQFTTVHENASLRDRYLMDYWLVLRTVLVPGVSVTEQKRHVDIINGWHDVFTGRLPPNTNISFESTLTMREVAEVDAQTTENFVPTMRSYIQ